MSCGFVNESQGIQLPADDYAGNLAANVVVDSVPAEECPVNDVMRSIKSTVCRKNVEQIRYCVLLY